VRGEPDGSLKTHRSHAHLTVKPKGRGGEAPLSKVCFRWKDYRQDGKAKVMTLAAGEFIRRFLLHVLPDGFHRIRYYGLFANGHRADKIELCRKLLDVTPASIERPGDDHDHESNSRIVVPLCPCCGGRMTAIETFDGPLSRSYRVRSFDSS
jgi:hypothetical protein